jgi:hypothetical protein
MKLALALMLGIASSTAFAADAPKSLTSAAAVR